MHARSARASMRASGLWTPVSWGAGGAGKHLVPSRPAPSSVRAHGRRATQGTWRKRWLCTTRFRWARGGEDAQEEAETRGRQKKTLVTQRRSSSSFGPRPSRPAPSPARAPCAWCTGRGRLAVEETRATTSRSSPLPRTLAPHPRPRAPRAQWCTGRGRLAVEETRATTRRGWSRRNAETRDGKREMLVEQRTSPPHSPTAHCAVERSAGAGENICVSAAS